MTEQLVVRPAIHQDETSQAQAPYECGVGAIGSSVNCTSDAILSCAEMFAGCGGLAYGLSRAGFSHLTFVEFDRSAIETVKYNKLQNLSYIKDWPIVHDDVWNVCWKKYSKKLTLISGGPPCQPFGIGGRKRGETDARDMWPAAIHAVREARPKAFIFENVRNLAGPRFSVYLNWIVENLKLPTIKKENGFHFRDHLEVLKRSQERPIYDVEYFVLNAADFGAPQTRYRVFVVGAESGRRQAFESIQQTHSRDRLLWDQYITGEYWDRHGLCRRSAPKDGMIAKRVGQLAGLSTPPEGNAWVTVRDAIVDLGEPNGEANHVLREGAKTYKGHTGSVLDLPAKALKAGDHGVPGGENMMVRDDGSVRYFTIREACRLMGLPDDYLFPNSWTESMRQLGNAVPTQLAFSVGEWLKKSYRLD